MKRTTDFIIAGMCLVVFSPLMLICALCIRWEDGLPVIYKQERIGLHGKPFYIYKFRSMRIDAEKDGPDLLEIKGDPRLTKNFPQSKKRWCIKIREGYRQYRWYV